MNEKSAPHTNPATSWVETQRRMWEDWLTKLQSQELTGEQLAPTAVWMSFCAENQRRLWEAWFTLAQAQPSSAQAGEPFSAWQGAMEFLRKTLVPFPESDDGDQSHSLFEQWLAFLRTSQHLAPITQGVPSWMSHAFSPFAEAGDKGDAAGGPGSVIARSFLALAGMPTDMWSRVMSSLSLAPGDAAATFKGMRLGEISAPARESLEKFVSMPPVGYSREWQEQGQQASRDCVRLQQALGAYCEITTRIAQHSGELVQHRLAQRQANEQPLQSLREIYDLFVDCAEEAYGEAVSGEEFGKVTAQLTNAAMALKRHSQIATDNTARAFNLPTRAELDTSHRHVHELKRELRAMQAGIRSLREGAPAGATADEPLRQEVARLREEVASLREQLESSEAAVSKPKRPAAARSRQPKPTISEG